MTECQECGRDGARDVRVTYTTGSAETLGLCECCKTEFENGGLIAEVVRPERCD